MTDENNHDKSVVADSYCKRLSSCLGVDNEELIQHSKSHLKERTNVWKSRFKRYLTYDSITETNGPISSIDNEEDGENMLNSHLVSSTWEDRLRFRKSKNAIQDWINNSNTFLDPIPNQEEEHPQLQDHPSVQDKPSSVLKVTDSVTKEQTPVLEDDHLPSRKQQSPSLQGDHVCTSRKPFKMLQNDYLPNRKECISPLQDAQSSTRNITPLQQNEFPCNKEKPTQLRQDDLFNVKDPSPLLQDNDLSTLHKPFELQLERDCDESGRSPNYHISPGSKNEYQVEVKNNCFLTNNDLKSINDFHQSNPIIQKETKQSHIICDVVELCKDYDISNKSQLEYKSEESTAKKKETPIKSNNEQANISTKHLQDDKYTHVICTDSLNTEIMEGVCQIVTKSDTPNILINTNNRQQYNINMNHLSSKLQNKEAHVQTLDQHKIIHYNVLYESEVVNTKYKKMHAVTVSHKTGQNKLQLEKIELADGISINSGHMTQQSQDGSSLRKNNSVSIHISPLKLNKPPQDLESDKAICLTRKCNSTYIDSLNVGKEINKYKSTNGNLDPIGTSPAKHIITLNHDNNQRGNERKHSITKCPYQRKTKHDCNNCLGLQECQGDSSELNLHLSNTTPVRCEGDHTDRFTSPVHFINGTSTPVDSSESKTLVSNSCDSQQPSRLKHRSRRERLPVFGRYKYANGRTHESCNVGINGEHFVPSFNSALQSGLPNAYKSKQCNDISVRTGTVKEQLSRHDSSISGDVDINGIEFQRRNLSNRIQSEELIHQKTETYLNRQIEKCEQFENDEFTDVCTEFPKECPLDKGINNVSETNLVSVQVSPLLNFKHQLCHKNSQKNRICFKSINSKPLEHITTLKHQHYIKNSFLNGKNVPETSNTYSLKQTLNHKNEKIDSSLLFEASALTNVNSCFGSKCIQSNNKKRKSSSDKIDLKCDFGELSAGVQTNKNIECTRLKETIHNCKCCLGLQACQCNFASFEPVTLTNIPPINRFEGDQMDRFTSADHFINGTSISVDCGKSEASISNNCDSQHSSRLVYHSRKKRLRVLSGQKKLHKYQNGKTHESCNVNINGEHFVPSVSLIIQPGLPNEHKSRQCNEICVRTSTVKKQLSRHDSSISGDVNINGIEFQRRNLYNEIQSEELLKKNTESKTKTYLSKQSEKCDQFENVEYTDVCTEFLKECPLDKGINYVKKTNLGSVQVSPLLNLNNQLKYKNTLMSSKLNESTDNSPLKCIKKAKHQENCNNSSLNGKHIPESSNTNTLKHIQTLNHNKKKETDSSLICRTGCSLNGSECIQLNKKEGKSLSDKVDLGCDFVVLNGGIKKYSNIECSPVKGSKNNHSSCSRSQACEEKCNSVSSNQHELYSLPNVKCDEIYKFTSKAQSFSSGDSRQASRSKHRKRKKRMPVFGRHNVLLRLKESVTNSECTTVPVTCVQWPRSVTDCEISLYSQEYL